MVKKNSASQVNIMPKERINYKEMAWCGMMIPFICHCYLGLFSHWFTPPNLTVSSKKSEPLPTLQTPQSIPL